jgi:hypothetical protein
MIRRINLFGGPGAGKTGLAQYLADELAQHRAKIMLVQEFAKYLAITNDIPEGWDQWHIWSEQQWSEYRWLKKNRMNHIVTDSPVFLASCYGEFNSAPGWKLLQEASDVYDIDYPALNIYLQRYDAHHEEHGRWQNLAEAKKIDEFVMARLLETKREFQVFGTLERPRILEYVVSSLGLPPKPPVQC